MIIAYRYLRYAYAIVLICIGMYSPTYRYYNIVDILKLPVAQVMQSRTDCQYFHNSLNFDLMLIVDKSGCLYEPNFYQRVVSQLLLKVASSTKALNFYKVFVIAVAINCEPSGDHLCSVHNPNLGVERLFR